MGKSGFVIGVDLQPLTVHTYIGTPLKCTITIQTDWIVAPYLFFPALDITWESTIVSGVPTAAQWNIDPTDIALVPHDTRVELWWDDRVMARGYLKRKGS